MSDNPNLHLLAGNAIAELSNELKAADGPSAINWPAIIALLMKILPIILEILPQKDPTYKP